MPTPLAVVVIVCGGRGYRDEATVARVLGGFRASNPIALLVAGGAPGADTLAVEWAQRNDVDYCIEPADWEQDGRAAGPIRNQRMIDKHEPSHLIAFPGGRGTADMIRRARRADVDVLMAEAFAGSHTPRGKDSAASPPCRDGAET